MKTLVCDRIEETLAVLGDGDGREVHLPLWVFENDVKEGDVIRLTVRTDKRATLARKEQMQKRFNHLIRKGEEKE